MPFALTERGESYRLELDRMMAERGLAIAPLVEAGNTETLVHVAERGVGVTFVPRFSAARALEHGTLVEVPCDLPSVEMESQLLWHERKWIAPPYGRVHGRRPRVLRAVTSAPRRWRARRRWARLRAGIRHSAVNARHGVRCLRCSAERGQAASSTMGGLFSRLS